MMGYRDNSGIEHESHEAACDYYGADSPRALKAAADRTLAQYKADVLEHGQAQADEWEMEGKYHV